MKPLLIQILFVALFTNSVLAIEPESGVKRPLNKLNINFQSNFFVANKDWYRDASFNSFNPGGEIMYERGMTAKVSFLTGANYIYSCWNYILGGKSYFKAIAHEIFIPVLFNTKLNNRIYLTTGIYPGWLLEGKQFYKNLSTVINWRDITETTSYPSSKKFSTDIFLGAAYSQPLNSKNSLDLSPFVKYKLTDNWMGERRNKLSYGVKINYAFEF